MTMLKLFCFITGDDYQLVNNDTPASKRKIKLLVNCLFLPVIVWTVNAVLLTKQVMLLPLSRAIIAGGVVGIVILLIERAVIMSNGSWVIALLRIVLGFAVAAVGALTFDEVIFKNEIDQQLTIDRKAWTEVCVSDLKNDVAAKKAALQDEIGRLQNEWSYLQTREIDNAEGKNGVPYGYGRVARTLDSKVGNIEGSMSRLRSESNTLDSLIDAQRQTLGSTFENRSLLNRIQALFHIVSKSIWAGVMYGLITLILLAIEFLVVIMKMCSKETNYEKKMNAIEKIGIDRLERIVSDDPAHFQPGRLYPVARRAQAAIDAHPPRILS